MDQYFKKLSGFKRGPTGLEWSLFKKLPKLLIYGTALISLIGYGMYAIDNSSSQTQVLYLLFGLLFSYWFFWGAALIGCIVVMLMKGPAYVADGYQLPKEDPNKEPFEL